MGFGGQWGYEGNADTGLHHLGARFYDTTARFYDTTARFYDTTAGRFVTRDPIGYKGGVNLYGFTGNNPVNESDPSGLDPLQLTFAGRIAGWLRRTFGRTTLKPGTATLGSHNHDIDVLTQGDEDDAGVNDVMRQTVSRVSQAGTAAGIELDNAIGTVGEAVVTEAPTGYTSHGINQAIGRNGGRGVKASYILDALRNPRRVINQEIGRKASVIVNNEGKIITVMGSRRGPQIYFDPNIAIRPSGSGSAQRKANTLGFSYNPRAIR